jgi:hypothetical protein
MAALQLPDFWDNKNDKAMQNRACHSNAVL